MSSVPSPLAARPGHELPFVQPSSYLRPSSRSHPFPPVAATPMSPIDEEQMQGLQGLRDFLRVRTSYDVLPLSFRLIILDNDLLIKKSLNILIQNGIVSAPLWDSQRSKFAGILTATDYINLIQYYCQFPQDIDNLDKFRLSSLRDIEKAIGVLPIETVSVHPSKPLYDAITSMLQTRARRIPLIDVDAETKRETVVSVITQYRILKFIAVNTEQYTSLLKKTVREINLGTYTNLQTGTMTQSVLEIINTMVTNNISAVPIVDKNNVVLNLFEAVDVIPIIKTGVVEELEINVGEALSKRGEEFGGIFTCQEDDRLDSIFITLRQSRVHRLIVIDDNWHLKGVPRGSLVLEAGTGRGISMVYGVNKIGPTLIHVAPYSSKYSINVRISTPWFSVRSVNLMSSHRYHQDQSMISEKGKEKEPVVAAWPKLPDSLNVPRAKPTRRPSLSQSIFAQSQPSNHPTPTEGDPTNTKQSSKTWTSSSEHSDLPVEEDGKDDRRHFVEEYNQLAQRHGLRPLVPGDFFSTNDSENVATGGRRDSWFSKMLRQAAEQSAETDSKPDRSSLRHQRNVSDVASGLVQGHRRDKLSDRDLATLVRLCGKSRLFLPTDYAPFSLTLPTCFRALAQALVQHADTKGIFRVPGSARVVNELYEYYCTNEDIDAISSTTRCPTLPTHIRCNTHDIASTFKRLLAGLPGGILGSLSLFDALVSIYSQMQGDAEVHRTKESKLRARLIALAIGTVRSRYQRELICAVFGLLCLVGRIAENAPREDDNGRPLPTADLMGYNALGIVFGPLLIGDLIDDYSMKVADPSAGLILLPISSPRSRKEKQKHRHRHRHRSRHRHKHADKHAPTMVSSSSVDKIRIANSITEMLIVHWREVVRQIRNTGSVKNRRGAANLLQHQGSVRDSLSSSASENLSLSNRPPLDESSSRSASPATVNLATPGMKHSNISSSEVIQKHPTTAIPPVLSPMIEENPSVSFDNHKPTLEEETVKNGEGGYTQDKHPISSHSHPRPLHSNDLANIASDSERTEKDTVGNRANTATSAVRSKHTQQSEMTPYPRKNMHSTPPLESPIAETTTQYEHDPVTPRAKPPRQSSLYNNIEEIDQASLNDDLTNRDSQQSQTTTKAAFTWKESSAELCYDKSGDDSFKNGDILLETPESGYAHSGNLNKHNPIDEVLGSPAGQWKNLLASSGESAESLARSAKARRLKRSSIPILRRPKDASVLTGSPSTLPKRKQQVLQTGHAPRDNLTSSKPNTGRDSTWKDATGSTRPILGTHAKSYSSGRHSSNIPQKWGSQRSTSKPMPGAVKAMAALFDSAAKESPDGSVVILNGRTRQSPNESTSFPGGGPLDGSPTKSKIPRGPPMPMASSRPNHASSPEKPNSRAHPHEYHAQHPKASENILVGQERATDVKKHYYDNNP
ncbi:hypothetical protein NPX13_g9816 [Xylaria arbuscula]|uniref:Rho-GAP domain-containing protein n=1 Tax=Xylaria arbuscula TaxID=114810 RepID=A0A9W8TH53_9PEZI|nr:hypothetical protein NPX13_g9816 [Xylaria arbuscula]